MYPWVCRKDDSEDPIEKALLGLPKDGLRLLLEYIREWNTKPKLCHVAQFVLFRVLRTLPPTDILEVTIPFPPPFSLPKNGLECVHGPDKLLLLLMMISPLCR